MSNGIEITHEILLDFEGRAEIHEVIRSLNGLEDIIERVPRFLCKLYPELGLAKMEVYLDEVSEGSLYEKFGLKLFFPGGEEEFNRAIEELARSLGIDKMSAKARLICLILGAITAMAGSAYLASHLGSPSTHIEATNSIIINDISGTLNIDRGVVEEAAAFATQHRSKSLGDSVVEFVAPARNRPGSSIYFSGDKQNPVGKIPAEAIQELPKEKAPSQKVELDKFYKDEPIYIRAIDLDNSERGWAMIAPRISDRRIRVEIHPSVNPLRLMTEKEIIADLRVTFRKTKSGTEKPFLYFIESVK